MRTTPKLLAVLLGAATALMASIAGGRAPAAGGTLTYVALGDSIAAWNGAQSYPADYGALVSADLKTGVNTLNFGIGGWNSGDLLAALQSDDVLRTDVASADIVTWDIGINDLQGPRYAYKTGTCGGSDGQDCLRAALSGFEANYPALITEIRTLNQKPLLVLRAVDAYNPFVAIDAADGSLTVLKPYFDAMNAHIRNASAAAGVPVAGVYTLFNGADGTDDPAAKGYLEPDGLHPSIAGSTAIAEAMRALMYEPLAYDTDADMVVDLSDNCPSVANPGQENHDANLVDLSMYGKLFDDTTWANSDELGDACDPDADNDGLPNEVESALPGPACPSATAPASPLLRDTDGDLVLDGAECALGTDPASAASKPPALPAGDSDHDGLGDAFERTIGSDPLQADTDGDGMLDGVEVKGYGTDPLSVNTDGDACADGKEAASINNDAKVNSIDLWQVALAWGPAISGRYIADMDVNKDGVVNSTDMAVAYRLWGYCR